MHSRGINLRFIVHLRKRVTLAWVKRLLLVEMAARVVRGALKSYVREAPTADVAAFLNDIITSGDPGRGAATTTLWATRICPQMLERYEGCVDDDAAAAPGELWRCAGGLPLLSRLVRARAHARAPCEQARV